MCRPDSAEAVRSRKGGESLGVVPRPQPLAACLRLAHPSEPARKRRMTAPEARFEAIDPASLPEALRRRRRRAALGRRAGRADGIYHYDPSRPRARPS